MHSCESATGATPGLAALLEACALDPAAALIRADAGARSGLGRIVVFIGGDTARDKPDDQIRTALAKGLVLCGEAADEQEVAIACAPDDPDAPYACRKSLGESASREGPAADVAKVALSRSGNSIFLFPASRGELPCHEACHPGFTEIGGTRYEVRILRNSTRTMEQVASAAEAAGASIPCPLAHAAWVGSGHGAYAEPVAYDGTERLICAVLDGECLGIVAQRGRWLDYESNHGSVADYLDGAFEPGETGSYYLEGQGWTVSAIPYEQDADAGFDVTLKRIATPEDAAVLGEDMANVESETEAYIEDGRR